MAQKWQTISELAAETSRKVTHSPEEWCRFLTTAARFYKAYDFDDQLLIYAQKPNVRHRHRRRFDYGRHFGI